MNRFELIAVRKTLGLSSVQMASLIGCTTRHYNYLEKGAYKPSETMLGVLERLQDFYNNLTWLLKRAVGNVENQDIKLPQFENTRSFITTFSDPIVQKLLIQASENMDCPWFANWFDNEIAMRVWNNVVASLFVQKAIVGIVSVQEPHELLLAIQAGVWE